MTTLDAVLLCPECTELMKAPSEVNYCLCSRCTTPMVPPVDGEIDGFSSEDDSDPDDDRNAAQPIEIISEVRDAIANGDQLEDIVYSIHDDYRHYSLAAAVVALIALSDAANPNAKPKAKRKPTKRKTK